MELSPDQAHCKTGAHTSCWLAASLCHIWHGWSVFKPQSFIQFNSPSLGECQNPNKKLALGNVCTLILCCVDHLVQLLLLFHAHSWRQQNKGQLVIRSEPTLYLRSLCDLPVRVGSYTIPVCGLMNCFSNFTFYKKRRAWLSIEKENMWSTISLLDPCFWNLIKRMAKQITFQPTWWWRIMFESRQIGQGFPHILSPLCRDTNTVMVMCETNASNNQGIHLEILQCRSCVSFVGGCLLYGSSCSLPTLVQRHTSQCILSQEKSNDIVENLQ